ncbi:hypothetical protein BAK_2831 [Bacillus anthracis str. A0389]|nr:hypothetical protein BAMEG_1866 [Bacillus anthracis str. CDC 684]EDS99177.1 hypothetical protein BAK_2831 [Bacillus anthracis str. A0389]EDT21236.1 hypothetical protein BAM_2791 [Bacillus anthracis str. A0465]EDT69957.1 hypothetical protein BAO_2738 [Bacillus anthracis str. A0174]EDV17517.1 hypothetical protein BATI_2638 [Bacillus anthracis str. Tsiankovskii-I]
MYFNDLFDTKTFALTFKKIVYLCLHIFVNTKRSEKLF